MKRAAAKREPVNASNPEEPETPPSTPRRPVTIKLAGKEYRLRSDASEESMQQVASYVDRLMLQIRERTDTVDSLDIALLTALNLAREAWHLRDQGGGSSANGLDEISDQDSDHKSEKVPDSRLRGLIEQVESALSSAESGRP
jgi:cell division protein ZapA (FtsZ GTPase activity inhibitor)